MLISNFNVEDITQKIFFLALRQKVLQKMLQKYRNVKY